MLTEAQVLARTKEITGAESVRKEKEILPTVWTILASFPDGPDAYTFRTYMVDLADDHEDVRVMGSPF